MAIVFRDGFESGALTLWSLTGPPVLETSVVFDGGNAMRFPASLLSHAQFTLASATATVTTRFFVRVSATLNSTGFNLLVTWNGTGNALNININTSNQLEVEDLGATLLATSSALVAGTWYEVVASYNNAAGGIIKVWLTAAGSERGNPFCDSTHAGAEATITIIDLGMRNAAQTAAIVYVDDIEIANDLVITYWPIQKPPRIKFVAAGTEGSAASGDVTPSTPAGLLANDLLILVMHSSDQVAHTMGTGWTQLVQGNGGGTTSRISVWWHRYDGTAMSSALVTHTAGQSPIAGITAFRCSYGNYLPVPHLSGAISGGTDASLEHATITPTMDGMLLLCHSAADDNNLTLLAGYRASYSEAGPTNNFKTTAGTPDGMVSLWCREMWIAATGSIVVTQAASDAWASVQIMLSCVRYQIQGGPVIVSAVHRASIH